MSPDDYNFSWFEVEKMMKEKDNPNEQRISALENIVDELQRQTKSLQNITKGQTKTIENLENRVAALEEQNIMLRDILGSLMKVSEEMKTRLSTPFLWNKLDWETYKAFDEYIKEDK